ncbi:glutamate--cysteine ligase regulatory subunit [Condylostylus longicornis]|uniref:glutamate--cysteine ligase regulatory subunit n=1 Tax=Condylostylus longicornis TaxID=2530218 RepID=UPI00244DF4D2|nr:glutamate--cysteine ligase regulatory subunit [Condylostylus longicornis]XP_055373130.1 glutamate--cysteine ligase regulatory subunit [Condylostylus longicornis]
MENLKKNNKILISTGNVLSFNKKVGQKPIEELIDCLSATLTNAQYHIKSGEIHRKNNDLHEKINEHERNSLKIGAKIFINHFKPESVEKAVDALLQILQLKCLDNVILAYHPINLVTNNSLSNGDMTNIINDKKPESFEWASGNNESAFNELKNLWTVLEKFQKENKICQLGISDLDTETLKKLYESCEVRPTIAKINLASCCVVPPSLQEFCNKNDIQLLTHSDPEVFLKHNSLEEWDLKEYEPSYVVRYTVHIKCRGVLAVKGYLVGASKH